MGTELNANTCSSNKSQEAEEGEGGELVLSADLLPFLLEGIKCYLKLVSWGEKA